MSDDNPLRAPAAARRLGIGTRELLRLTYDRVIPFVIIDGVAHYKPSDLDAYRLEHGLSESRERDRSLLREVWPLVVLAANEYSALAGHGGFDHLAADIALAVSVRDRIASGELPPW